MIQKNRAAKVPLLETVLPVLELLLLHECVDSGNQTPSLGPAAAVDSRKDVEIWDCFATCAAAAGRIRGLWIVLLEKLRIRRRGYLRLDSVCGSPIIKTLGWVQSRFGISKVYLRRRLPGYQSILL